MRQGWAFFMEESGHGRTKRYDTLRRSITAGQESCSTERRNTLKVLSWCIKTSLISSVQCDYKARLVSTWIQPQSTGKCSQPVFRNWASQPDVRILWCHNKKKTPSSAHLGPTPAGFGFSEAFCLKSALFRESQAFLSCDWLTLSICYWSSTEKLREET